MEDLQALPTWNEKFTTKHDGKLIYTLLGCWQKPASIPI